MYRGKQAFGMLVHLGASIPCERYNEVVNPADALVRNFRSLANDTRAMSVSLKLRLKGMST